MAYLTLVPAYGRDYKSAKQVKEAWNEGKDFQISNVFSPDDGRYVSCNDSLSNVTLNIRYKGLRNIAVIKLK